MTNSFQVELLNDNLIIDEDNSFELPDWALTVFPDLLYPVSARSQALFTETAYMKRVKGGPLITKIVGDMDLKRNGDLTQNMTFYSAHDVTLTNVMRALEIQNQTSILPEYGAALIFELNRFREISDWFVNVSKRAIYLLINYFYLSSILFRSRIYLTFRQLLYYKSAEAKKPIQVTIPDCTDPCSLDDFIDIYADSVFITDFDAECQLDSESSE